MKDDNNLFDQQTAWDSLPRRKVRKHKVDPEKRQIMTWHRFNQKFEHLSSQNRRAKWKHCHGVRNLHAQRFQRVGIDMVRMHQRIMILQWNTTVAVKLCKTIP